MPTLGKSSVVKLDNAAGTITDISAYITDFSGFGNSTDMLSSETFGDSSKEFFPGLRNGDVITISGKWDSTLHTQLTGLLGQTTSSTLEYFPAGGASPKASMETFLSAYDVTSTVADLVMFTASLQVTGAVTWS